MHTSELDVRQLLEIISRRSGMNILVSPQVSGNITANFEKVTLDQLLRSVLRLANLEEKVEGPIHYIFTQEELRAERESKKKERILTRVYRLNYVRADELMVLIGPFLSQDVGQKRIQSTPNYPFGISEAPAFSSLGGSGGGGAAGGGAGGGGAVGGGSLVQPFRGFQPPTGGTSLAGIDVLIVQDYESNLKIIDQIVQRIDIQPIQVLIEAVIVSVALDRTKELGVNFGVVDNLGQALGTIGAGSVLNANVGFNPTSVLTAAGKIAGSATADPTGLAAGSNGIKFGFVSNNVTGFVRALESLGSTKVLASPRVLVLNKQRAEIQLGARLGFRAITAQNYTSTVQGIQFLNVGTLLRLRPIVSTDGMVRMEIHPERSQGEVNADGLPNATTAEVTTNVMVPDGATIVIGGLMEDEDDYNYQGLPGISRIPALAQIFGFKQKRDLRRELVVLLTPRIWNPATASAPCLDEELPPADMNLPDAAASAAVTAPRESLASTSAAASPRSGATASDHPAEATPAAATVATPLPGTGAATPRSKPAARGLRARLGWPARSQPVSPAPASASAGPALRTTGRDASTPRGPFAPSPPERRAAHLTAAPRGQAGELTSSQETLLAVPTPAFDPLVVRTGLGFGWTSPRYLDRWSDPAPPPPSSSTSRSGPAVPQTPETPGQTTAALQEPRPFPLPLNGTPLMDPPPKRDPALTPSSLKPDEDAPPQVVPGIPQTRQAPRPLDPDPAAGGGYSVHVVRRGETLEAIAADRLGDPRRAGEIAALNRDILDSPARPRPGQRLILPADLASPPQAQRARPPG